MSQLRVLFAGLGGVGQRHLRNLRALLGDDVDIGAYRVRGEPHAIGDALHIEAGPGVEERYRVRVHRDLEGALAAGPDAVFVTNPTSLHVGVAIAAARAGCHLFVEKPLCDDLAGVEELIETVESRGTVALVAYQLRWHPAFATLREWLAGSMGRVLSVRATVGEYLPDFHPYEDYRRMYASRRALGGGVTLTQIHEIDLLYALFGLPSRVFSMGTKVSDLEIDVEDVACSLLEFRGADGRPFFAELHQDYFARPKSRSMTLVCERGRIEWDLAAGVLTRFRADGSVREIDYRSFVRNEMFLGEMSHFLACVRGEDSPLVTLRDGAASVRIALALLASQASGREVRVEGRKRQEAA